MLKSLNLLTGITGALSLLGESELIIEYKEGDYFEYF